MGCGACVESNTTVQPVNTRQPKSILCNLIDLYLCRIQTQTPQSDNEQLKVHPAISLDQCKHIRNFLASTNGQLPEISYSQDYFVESNQVSNASGATRPLLDQIQKIVWKCLVILPELEEGNINMVPLFKEYIADSEEIVQHSFHQIGLDVNRTFPSLKQLDRAGLTIILRNMVNCFPQIGYTQGMNFYCGFLLLCGFTPCQSYYLMVCLFISPNFFLALNFNSAFSQVMTCCKLFANTIPKNLRSHIHDLGLTEEMYCFSWFLCSFLYTLPPQSCAILWDYMIKSGACRDSCGGFTSILNFSISLMEYLENDVLKADSPEELLSILRSESLKSKIYWKDVKNMTEILKKQKKMSKRKQKIVTKKQMMEDNKQLREVLTNRESYEKYVSKIMSLDRNTSKVKKEDEEKVVHIGKTELIKLETKQK